MEALNELLARLPDGTLGTVVVVGAGRNEAARALSQRANAVILVEGDPDAIAELKAQTASDGPQLRIVDVPVAADTGVLNWNRYNLRWLNGPLDATGLVRWYPRLQTLGALPLRAKALRELLAEVDLIADAQVPNVLVLDVPGQEGPLLESVDATVLELFDWILVTGCAEPPEAGWCTPSRSDEHLRRVGFEPTGPAGNEHAQWPRRLFRLNRMALDHRRTVAALRVASDRVLALEEETAGLRSKCSVLERTRATLDTTLDLAQKHHAGLEAQMRAQQTRIDELEAALALAQKLAADRGGELQTTRRAAKEVETALVQQVGVSADRIAALEVEAAEVLSRTRADRDAALAEMRARLQDAESSAAAARTMVEERSGQLSKLEAELLQRQRLAESDNADATRRLSASEAERDRLAAALAEQQRVAIEAAAAQDAHSAELIGLQARVQALESERLKAGQENTELSVQIKALELELQVSQANLSARQAELAAALQEAEGLRAQGTKSRDQHEQALATARKEVRAAQQAAQADVERFKEEMEQLRLRQRLLGEEMIRAEGQIDLIKDVLLREAGL